MEFIKLDNNTITTKLFAQLIDLEENCGLEPFSPEMLQECIEDMDTYAYMDEDTVCGFITIHPSTRYLGGGIYIVNLNVAQAYRRRGVGTKLMLAALAQYSTSHRNQIVTLDVAKTNTSAINLYKKIGFQITDLPSGNGETDFVMTASAHHILGIAETSNLTLSPIPFEDAMQLSNILRNDIINRTYMVPDLSEAAALNLAHRIATLSCDSSRYVRGVYLENTLIGLINDVDIKDTAIELGWVIHPAYHNCGYATEAICSAIKDLFNRGYTEVAAGAFASNLASIRVMQKCGMHLQEQTEEIEYRGKTHKCVYYAIRRNV